MGRRACTEPQCLYKGVLYLFTCNYGQQFCFRFIILAFYHRRYYHATWQAKGLMIPRFTAKFSVFAAWSYASHCKRSFFVSRRMSFSKFCVKCPAVVKSDLSRKVGGRRRAAVMAFTVVGSDSRRIFCVANCEEALLDCLCKYNRMPCGKNSGRGDNFRRQRIKACSREWCVGRANERGSLRAPAALTLILLTWRIGWAHNNARK